MQFEQYSTQNPCHYMQTTAETGAKLPGSIMALIGHCPQLLRSAANHLQAK
jgi:hypothetical protein